MSFFETKGGGPHDLPADKDLIRREKERNEKASRKIYCRANGCHSCTTAAQIAHSCFLCKVADSDHLPLDCDIAARGCSVEACDVKNLWICMHCGYIGCGRVGGGNKHAEMHYLSFENTAVESANHNKHNRMVEISTKKVFDYCLDSFVGILSDHPNKPAATSTGASTDDWCTNSIIKKKISASTISVIWDRKLLCGLRGVRGRHHGFVFSQGGSIDDGETAIDAAIRECAEEAGLDLSPRDVQLLEMNYECGRADFYCVLSTSQSSTIETAATLGTTCAGSSTTSTQVLPPPPPPAPFVRGPDLACQWEVLQTDQLARMFGCDMILRSEQLHPPSNPSNPSNPSRVNSGLAWVPIDKLLASTEDIVAKSPSIKLLRKIVDRLGI